jgi:hypothetical protein
VLWLRPEALVKALGERHGLEPEAEMLLRHVDRAMILSREADESLTVELQIPSLTPAFRALLRAVAERLDTVNPGASGTR